MRRLRALALAAIGLCAAACSFDWDGFVADDGGTSDGGSALNDGGTPTNESGTGNDAGQVDAGVDAGPPCNPNPDCLSAAVNCALGCGDAGAQCTAACSNPKCRKDCNDVQSACRNGCESTCNACAQAANCPTPGGCSTASQQ